MFLSAPRADGPADRSVFGDFWFTPLGFGRGAVRVTPATALGLPVVYACLRVVAESFAIMPFCLYQPKAGGGRARVTNHWIYRLFAKAPNRFQTPYEFRLMLQGHLALRGNAFCQITANNRGEIVELLPLHPDRMSIQLASSGDYAYVYRDDSGTDIPFTRGQIWHLRGASDDGYMGMSPIQLACNAIGEGLSIQDYSARFFANDAQPGGGWIEYPGGFANTDAKKTFRESWQQMQGGGNRGKVAVLERGMKYHELGINNKEAQFIESRQDKRKEIPAIWRVPQHKVGVMDNATFTNIEQQSIELWTDCILPYAELWESSIQYFLLGPDDAAGLEVEFDMSRMLRGDSVARSDYYQAGINSGWLTRNEARAAEGYDPIEGLDEPLRPLNMVEDSEAPDELAEGDDGTDDAGNNADGNDADARRARHRARRRAARRALEASASVRVQAMLQSNAQRMVRRLGAGKPVPADTLAEAMNITVPRAETWLELDRSGYSEDQLVASLVETATR